MDPNAEIAASLAMDDIPVKLRCAACNKLALNAYRTPCCDQSICEGCQASLPEACPVCLHEPVRTDDCRPNKALRTTIKAFLKRKIMERESARKKEVLEKVATTPATLTPIKNPTPQEVQTLVPAATEALPEGDDADKELRDEIPASHQSKAMPDIPTEAQKDIPQKSIESPGVELPRRDSAQTAGEESAGLEKGDTQEKSSEQQQLYHQNEQWTSMNGLAQGMNNGFNFNGTGFSNMGFNELNPMMQFLPNGMPNAMMGPFPNAMGMTGIGMDPMTLSQGIYGGFGGQGMGMNGMNMGMGFDAGQGAFGGFNGQPAAWNAGQNKYNQNAYGGHAGMNGGADFGANAGYGGYNMPPHQGNFSQMNHHQYSNNDFHHGHHGQGFQNRGRGRGRGFQYAGRGRGGYNQIAQGNNQTNYEPHHQQVSQSQITRRGSPQYGEKLEQPEKPQQEQASAENQQDSNSQIMSNGLNAEDHLNKELAPGDADDNIENAKPLSSKEDVAGASEFLEAENEASGQTLVKVDLVKEDDRAKAIETFIPEELPKSNVTLGRDETIDAATIMPPPNAVIPIGPAANHQSLDMSPRGRGSGRSYHRGVHFRPGSQGQGSGYIPNSNISQVQSTLLTVKPPIIPIEPKGLGVEGAPKAPKALRDAQPSTAVRGFSIVGRASAAAQARPSDKTSTMSPSHNRSRSPSRHQSNHHRHHRHRSSSPSENEREKRRERHHHQSRKHGDENGDSYDIKNPRARDVSADSSSKRYSHRSHRDHEKDRDSERSSRRSHRHRERSRDRDDEHRSGKNRSLSPEISINGASRANGAAKKSKSSYHDSKNEDSLQPSRKRRSDDEEYHQDHHRERKRSRRDHEESVEEKPNGHRSSKREVKDSRANPDRAARNHEKLTDKELADPTSAPRGPKIDQHALEREARNAERVARENERRALQQGGVGTVAKGGKVNVKGRRMSYKYEDDESIEARTSRIESEREALRFR